MNLKPAQRATTLVFLLSAAASAAGMKGGAARDYVPTYFDHQEVLSIEKTKPVISSDVPLGEEVVAWAVRENYGRKATFTQSDSSKVTYDKEIGVITIESPGGLKQYILARGFRVLTMKWINDRLLFINCDTGHVSAVEAMFDSDQGKWVYQRGIHWHLE
jgi:hypothetical protein